MKPTEITRVQELIYELKIAKVMTNRLITVTPDISIAEFREVLRINRISGTPVTENGRMVGIISLEDLIKALSQGDLGSPVRDKMTRSVYTVPARESVIEAVKIFSQKGVGRLPVVDEQGSLVGIITQGDITHGLLKAIEMDYHAEEISRYRASHIFEDIISDSTSMLLRYKVNARDFGKGGEAGSKIKQALTRLGGDPQIIRRVAIATYEAEMNIIIHTDNGGEIVAEIQPDQVCVRAVDHGPGIADVEQAMQPGFSLAPEWIREMGFGAGVGLNNIQKCADEMNLESTLGVGTRLQFTIYLRPGGEGRTGGRNETS
ncbi:MAG: Serine/threonine-protein kinase RsbT [Dehalococcoidia bacterium]|nr:Serine/threonine-protein kinase RsbT [Bacillota bacterium]MBT9143509.1 Serine/threonine-protein kinase RsbT [Bacillota bacterium]